MKYSLPLLRTPAGSSQDVVIATDDWFAARTHWLGRKKLLCSKENCPGCVIDGGRTAVYVVVFAPVPGRHYLLEITEMSWLAIKFLCGGRREANLQPGDVLTLHRKRKRSPLRVEVVDHKPDAGAHPQLTTLRAVSALYRLPLPDVDAPPAEYLERHAEILRFRLRSEIRELGESTLIA